MLNWILDIQTSLECIRNDTDVALHAGYREKPLGGKELDDRSPVAVNGNIYPEKMCYHVIRVSKALAKI